MHDTTSGPTFAVDVPSDADLTDRLRSGPPHLAERALSELYRRHHTSVLAYARTCTRDVYTAEDLASEAFARTLRAVQGGAGPRDAWRPYLLTTVRRAAADWAATARRTELSADFETWLAEAPVEASGEDLVLLHEDSDLVRRAFRRLPERWQGALWYSAVEGEPPSRIAVLLGISASGVTSLTARAREGLREAYLTEYAIDAKASEECRFFTAQLAAAIRHDRSRRQPRALRRHLDDCPRCRRAECRIRELNSSLSVVLPAGVLLWAGASYGGEAAGATTAGTASAMTGGVGPAAPLKAIGIGATVLTLALGGYAFLPDGDDSPEPPQALTSDRPTPQTEAITPTPTLTPSRTPTRSEPESSPSSAAPTPTAENSSQPPSWQPAADDRAQLPIVSTGKCMDIATTESAEPYEATCNGSRSQQWELLVDRAGQEVRIRNYASGMCLAHSGESTDGAPVRQERTACGSTTTTARWTYFVVGDGEVNFAQKNNHLYVLGLDEWNKTADGQPHASAIGTSANYYASASFRFRYTGDVLGG
ncbi:sigma-70 family RNA polymerase sigma factor [Streptomyces coerulescens]|uniref:Sigma-70 family RNA polymerase sigma factor n=1 Tax=Streptomyces coerulescens TaxID=29304 RepID=A0ABW0CV69_STRCD